MNAGASSRLSSNALPAFPPGGIIEAIDGVIIHDPYRALEENTPETLAWENAQSAATSAFLRQGRFPAVAAALREYMQAADVQAPKYSAAGWFRPKQDGLGTTLILSETILGRGSELTAGAIDPEDREAPTFAWYQPSPDGKLVVYGAPEGGGLQGGAQLVRLRVLDRTSGTDLPVRIPHGVAAVAWRPDSTGFYFIFGPHTASEDPERRVAFQSVCGDLEKTEEPLRGLGFEARLQLSPDGRYLAVRTGTREPRADWLLDCTTGQWKPFLLHVPAVCFGEFHGDRYIAFTTWNRAYGRVVSIPVTTAADTTTWQEIVPQSDVIIRALTVIGDEIVLTEFLEQGGSRIRVVALDGTKAFTVPTRPGGSIATHGATGWFQSLGTPAVSAGNGGFAFVESTYARSPGLYWVDLKTRTLETLLPPVRELDELIVTRHYFTGNDGTPIPATIVCRRGIVTPAPAVIFSYGAYNFATVPGWIGVLGPFVEAGGIAVFAHLRGGGELGTEWWRVAHHEERQKSYDDIYTVAEGMIAAGLTTPAQLGLLGLSNGGTNVCTALTQRPELFRAGVAMAPQTDLIRYNRDPFCGGVATTGHHQGLHVNSGIWRDPRWGAEGKLRQPARPLHLSQSMYPDALDYSPYHLIRDGVEYPALLLVCETEDVWCPGWHSRKLAARMQAATASERPILIRSWEGGGHDHPMTDRRQVAEWLTFLMNELGTEGAI